jgi:hypothetical protein
LAKTARPVIGTIIKMRKLTLIIILLILSCRQMPQENTYGYKHLETTGITNYLVTDNGEDIPIQFSSSSDKKALEALHGLKWNVLLPNANGTNITITGVLNEKMQYTTNEPNQVQREKYQEFELHSWKIFIPFQRQYWKDGIEGPDGLLLSEKKMNLDVNDFSININNDLSEFEATSHNQTTNPTGR